ncbi:MAG: (2Fe-2S)-binding protein [Deferribacteres bacterium]|nr:(2Fe-2S)-binding protein [candidate division KSB1 bacterium]MCB9501731.1 (2Fe-2S)-binding protein [Deferribacteres bacterium]
MDHPKNKKTNETNPKGISRRGFLKGLGVTSIGVAAAPKSELLAKLEKTPSPNGKLLGKDAVIITLEVNGKSLQVEVEPRFTLAEVLRDHLNLTGTKIGCERGACGACTVIMNGVTVNSCMTLAVDAIGQKIETIEGLEKDGHLSKLQESFIEHDGMQCGFCTPGMIMSAKDLLDKNPHPTREEAQEATAGNLCRCGTYPKVFEAIVAAGK